MRVKINREKKDIMSEEKSKSKKAKAIIKL